MEEHKLRVVLQSIFNDEGVKKAKRAVGSIAKDVAKASKGFFIKPKYDTKPMQKLKGELKQLEDAWKRCKEAEDRVAVKSVDTAEWRGLNEEAEKFADKLNKSIARSQILQKTLANIDRGALERAADKANSAADSKYLEWQNQQMRASKTRQAMSGTKGDERASLKAQLLEEEQAVKSLGEELVKLEQEREAANNALTQYDGWVDELEREQAKVEEYTSSLHRAEQAVRDFKGAKSEPSPKLLEAQADTKYYENLMKAKQMEIDNLYASGKGSVEGLSKFQKMKIVIDSLRKSLARLFPMFRKNSKAMGDMSKGMRSTLGTGGALSRMFRTIAISGRFMVASMVWRGLFNGITQGFTDLYNYGGRTAQTLLSLKNALAGLRGSFAAAFAPILNFVAPALNYLIGLLTAAMNAIARFFAVLTGAGTYEKASFGAEGFEAAGGAAGGANKKAKEYQKTLLGFDKINKLNEEPKSSGGGGGGGGSTTEATWKEAIAKSKFADMVKDAWKVGDFTDVGKYVANQLADALEKINWTRIKATAQKIGESIATFINGACQVPRLWEDIGITIGEGINTALRFVYGFVKKIDATAVANAISTAISTALKTIEWDILAYDIVVGVSKAIKVVIKTLAGLDWIGIGKSIIGGIGKGIKDSLADDPSNILGLTLITLFITNKMRKLVADIRKGFMGSTKGVDIPAPKTTGWGSVGTAIKLIKDKLETLYLYVLEYAPVIGSLFSTLIPVAVVVGACATIGIAIKGMYDHWGESVQDFKKNDPTGYAKTYGQSLHEMSGYADKGISGFAATAKKALGKGGTVPNAMINTSDEANTFKTKVLEKWNALKNSDAWQTIKTHINDNMSKAKESGTKSNNSLIENMVKGWQDAKENIKKIVGKIKDMFNFKWKLPKLPQFKIEWTTHSKGGFTVNLPSIKQYALGGFPEEGPFMMNRGEIAGKFSNGKSVVANNQQITQGIASAVGPAVYDAVSQAMKQYGGANATFKIEGDPHGMFKVMQKEANQYQQATGQFAFDF